jgi:hypothetical protein
MKPAIVVFRLLLIIALCVTISGCKKDSGCTNIQAANYNSNAKVDDGTCQYSATFYFDQDGPDATVQVKYQTGNITTSYQHGAPTCGSNAVGCANFVFPVGSYTYTATSSLASWSGTLVMNGGGCQLMPLRQSHGCVMFYTTANYGPISVNVNGVLDSITQNVSTTTPDCGDSACASFFLDPYLTYNYTATSQGGRHWTGQVVGPVADACLPVLLQ